MAWFDKLKFWEKKPPQKVPARLTAQAVFDNEKNEISLAEYPKDLYSHTWEKILTESPTEIICKLRFYSRAGQGAASEFLIAEPTLLGVTKKANQVILSEMPKYRKNTE